MEMLVDTGILLRAFDANFADYRTIRRVLRKALDDGVRLVVTVQNMAEFWNVATRPLDKNGHGLSTERVKRRLAIIEQLCELASEDTGSYAEWKRIVEVVGVTGVAVHDARLVSVMLRLGIKEILTLNERDFHRYQGEGIDALTPQTFLGAAT
jgi:predicted nucleic acid-binding protein